MTSKGFVPIIFIIIGVGVIVSATFGIIYRDKITASVINILGRSRIENQSIGEIKTDISKQIITEDKEAKTEERNNPKLQIEEKKLEEKVIVAEKTAEKQILDNEQTQDQKPAEPVIECCNRSSQEENPVPTTIEAYFYKNSIPADTKTITKIEARVLNQFNEGMSEQLVGCTLPNGLIFKKTTNSYGFVYFEYQSTGNVGINTVYIESGGVSEAIKIEETSLPEPEPEPQKEQEPEPKPEIIEEKFTYTFYDATNFGIGENNYDTFIPLRTNKPIQNETGLVQRELIGGIGGESNNIYIRNVGASCRGACNGYFYEIVLDDLHYGVKYQVKIYAVDKKVNGNVLIDDISPIVFRAKD
jgi:hypothetical protein